MKDAMYNAERCIPFYGELSDEEMNYREWENSLTEAEWEQIMEEALADSDLPF